jgi:Cu-Zn family superoxide dismutase
MANGTAGQRSDADAKPGCVRAVLAAIAAAVAAGALAGCSLFKSNDQASANVAMHPPAAKGMEARMRPLHSAVSGKARVLDRGDGATLLLSMINLPEGRYRVALHERPNCTSPNGFSAGPVWAPPSSARDPRELIGPLTTSREGTAEASVHLRGVHTTGPDGVAGRSIVVYAGSAVTEARPDVPNNMIACGVFEPTETFQF